MSMCCLRIRSSSKSSGPSYTSVTETANGESLSSFFVPCGFDSFPAADAALPFPTSTGTRGCTALSSDATIFSCRLLLIFHRRWFIFERHPHRVAHILHGFGRRLPRPFRACLKNIPSQPQILLDFLAPLLHGTQQLHQCIGHPALALDAANPRRPPAGVHLFHGCRIAENLLQIAPRT